MTNLITGKYYRGKHSTDDPDDGYYGSSEQLRKAIVKHGIENFKKEILFCAFTESLAYEVEGNVFVTEEEVKDPNCYNAITGGRGVSSFDVRGRMVSEKTRKKISESCVMRGIPSEQHPMFGRKHSEQTKQKWSEDRSGAGNSMYGRVGTDHPKTGFKHSEETRERQREALSGQNNPMYGRKGKDSPRAVEVEIDGMVFETMTEAAKYFNVNTGTISEWVRKGKHGAQAKNTSRTVRVKVDGKIFETMVEAAKYFGKNPGTIADWVNNGRFGSCRLDD